MKHELRQMRARRWRNRELFGERSNHQRHLTHSTPLVQIRLKIISCASLDLAISRIWTLWRSAALFG
jgi:hypothetical protein